MKKMNDITELKHIFVSSQTKLFAALAIITFMIAGSLHAQVQNDNLAASIDNLDKLTGCSEEQVKAAYIDNNTFPTDDKSKIFFLYNVKTGLLLNAGGYWGTHVSLKEFGMPLWIHKDKDEYIHFAQNFDKTGASSEEGRHRDTIQEHQRDRPRQRCCGDARFHPIHHLPYQAPGVGANPCLHSTADKDGK